MSPRDIDPNDLRAVASSLLGRIHGDLSHDVKRAAEQLNACSRMAGDDTAGTIFGTAYDKATGGRHGGLGVIEVVTLCANVAGTLQVLLNQTADNIDAAAVIDDESENGTPPSLTRIPKLRSARGKGIIPPAWWPEVEPYVGTKWPNGDEAKLESAAEAWNDLQAENSGLECDFLSSYNKLQEQKWQVLDVIENDIEALEDCLNSALVDAISISDMCDSYKTLLSSRRSQIETTLRKELSSNGVGDYILFWRDEENREAKIKKAAQKIRKIIDSLINESTKFTSDGDTISESSSSSEGFLMEIINRSPVDALADEDEKYRTDGLREFHRPKLSAAMKEQIQQQTPKVFRHGQWFFVTGEDGNILIPVDRQYHSDFYSDYSQNGHPGGPQDKYYVDPATGEQYPRDPNWDYGHARGSEWWRLHEMAKKNNWSQDELNAYANSNAQMYQIEDSHSNRSHRFEMPREEGDG